MITKNDCVLLLTELQDNGIDIGDNIIKVLRAKNIPLDVLEFINKNRQLDLTSFYTKLRKSYNHKRSKLYINIVREVGGVDDILTTLSAYALQAILYSKSVEDSQMFLRHSRVREINLALAKYFSDFDLSICEQLLKLLKADMLACEMISGRREKQVREEE